MCRRGAEIEFTDIGGLIGHTLFGAAGGADEEPKYGGTLTYMIPADAPPSFRRAS